MQAISELRNFNNRDNPDKSIGLIIKPGYPFKNYPKFWIIGYNSNILSVQGIKETSIYIILSH